MNDEREKGSKMEKFLNGKGFYIALFMCLVVIGASAWAILYTEQLSNGTEDDYEAVMSNGEGETFDPYESEDLEDVQTNTDLGLEDAEKPVVSTENEDKDSGNTEKEEENKANDNAEAGDETQNTAELVYIWPLSGETVKAYSPDELVFNKTMGDWRTHRGVDIGAAVGTKVMAVADGKVEKVYEDDLLGTTVIIDHGNGLKSVYSNLAKTPTVKEGDAVTMSSVIGAVGDTAIAESGEVSHLHFEMTMEGKPIDPADVLPKK